jgi:hypothetical protein
LEEVVCVEVAELLRGVLELDVSTLDVPEVRAALADVGRVQSCVDGVKVTLSRRLSELVTVAPSMSPDHEIAKGTRSSLRDAEKVGERAKVLDRNPTLEDKLRAGEVSAEHVDVLARGAKQLEPAQRESLFGEHGERLAEIAARATPEEFARAVKQAVNQVSADDGLSRLERQKRATRLRTWTDRDTGMVHLHGQFDPESGLTLLGRLHNTVETLFHDQVPDTCPTDPEHKQDHLRALALIALTEGRGESGRREFIIVVDEHTLRVGLHDQSIIDTGIDGLELPVETLRRMACLAGIIPIVLNSDGVAVDEGRRVRVATRAQRRAARAMYPTCAGPGCRVRFEHCELHHIRYWEQHGRSDMDNFIPLCSKHHHAVHEGGWHLHLDRVTRVLTITYPEGTTRSDAAPRARVWARARSA